LGETRKRGDRREEEPIPAQKHGAEKPFWEKTKKKPKFLRHTPKKGHFPVRKKEGRVEKRKEVP